MLVKIDNVLWLNLDDISSVWEGSWTSGWESDNSLKHYKGCKIKMKSGDQWKIYNTSAQEIYNILYEIKSEGPYR